MIGLLVLLAAQEVPKAATLSIERVRSVPQIYVSIGIETTDRPLFVPYCGTSEGGERILCTAGTRLEVQVQGGWIPVKRKTTHGVLGAAQLDRTGGRLIEPQSRATFLLQFSTHFFDVAPGQRLRVVVDTWADETSMKSRQLPIPFSSPAFTCCDDQ
jgi:hypothetical protein